MLCRRPGALAPLRGPAALNRAALEHGEAVVASDGGLGLVPHRVGAGHPVAGVAGRPAVAHRTARTRRSGC